MVETRASELNAPCSPEYDQTEVRLDRARNKVPQNEISIYKEHLCGKRLPSADTWSSECGGYYVSVGELLTTDNLQNRLRIYSQCGCTQRNWLGWLRVTVLNICVCIGMCV